jgi:hypothetical protein
MAKIVWTNTAGGDFANASNWQGGAVPGASDDALLTTVGTYTVTSNQNETVNSLQMISTVTFDITGGTFQMTNGSGSGTDNGLIEVNGNDSLVIGGTLAGTGTVQLNTNGYTDQILLNSATTTLSGGGKIVMSDNGANYIYAATAGNVLNNVNDTISGGGHLGDDQTGLDNQSGGVIDGTGTSSTMILDFGAYSALNAGLIEATGPAGLQIQNSTITNTGGTLKAVGANVGLNLVNTTIVGGTLLTTTGGVIETNGGNTATLNGVTIAAASTMLVNNNSTLDIANTITNKGTISLNTDGYNDVLQVTSSTVTLTGAGSVILSDQAANYIYGAAATDKLINVNNKISGSGQFGSNSLVFDNQAAGVINATGTANGLTIFAGASTNEGLIEDTGPAGLGINATTITNKGTILSTGTGSLVNLYNNTDIIGGTLATAKTGVIGTNGGNTALLDGSTKTGAVTLTAASLFEINNNSTLDVLGSIVNDGTIQMNADGYSNDLVIDSPTVTLSGGGKLTLNDVYSNRIYGAVGTDKLINVNNTISGSGQFGVNQLTVDNQTAGIINSTGTAGLTLQLTAFTNEGLVEDTGVGGLGLDATTLVNNATLAATGAGATFNIYNGAVIEGGKLTTSGGGVFETTNYGTLDGATNGALTLSTNSVFDINGNTTLDLLGSIVNQGTIAMNADGYSNDLIINSPTVTLTGGGKILMNDVGSNRIYGASASNLLINVNNTISGSGQIGANQGSFDNQALGVIDATGTAAGITILAQSFTNEGLIEDTNTGGVGIQSTTIVNNGTLLSTGVGSTVNEYNSSVIEGGTLTSTAGGVFETTNTATLDGATNGAVTLTAGSVFDINGNTTLDLVGTMVNHGIIAMNADGYDNDLIASSATVTLTGGGTIAMNDVGSNRIYGATSADVFVNVNNTITGSGQIGAGQGTIDNQAAGIIDSTGTVGLFLSANAFTNEGLIESTNTGGVTLYSTLVNSGTVAAYGAGNAFNMVNGASIEGGTLAATGGGFFETTNYATLDGATNGAVTLTSGASFYLNGNVTLYVGGTVVNQGLIALNTDGYNDDLIVNAPTVTLSGGGHLTLSDAGANRIYGTAAADKLVNVNNTISGSGQLGAGQLTLDNQKAGIINATGTSTNLNINLGSTFTNEGLVEATGPAGLFMQNTTFTNTGTVAALSASSLTIDGSNVVTNYNAGTLTGGTWEALAATGATSTLALNSIGAITTDTAHLILSGAGASITTSGTAVVTTLTSITAGGELDVLSGATFASTNALSDAGVIALSGTLSAKALTTTTKGVVTASGIAKLSTSGKFTNAGTVQATSGTLTIAKGTLSNSGTVAANGGVVNILAAEKISNLVTGTLTGGTWSATGSGAALILGAGSVTTDAAIITLSGAGSNLDGGATKTTLDASLTTIAAGAQLNLLNGRGFASTSAGLTDSGLITLGGGSFTDTSLTIAAGATFEGAGTLAGAVTDTGTLASAAITGGNGTLTVTGAISGTGLLQANAATDLTTTAGFTVGSLTIASTGTFAGAGTVTGAITDGGSLLLSGGTLSGGSLTVGAGALLSGSGTVKTSVTNSGTIAASGGTLTLAAGESGGALSVGAGAALVSTADAVSAASLSVAAGGSFTGFGSITAAVANLGTVAANGGTLTLTGGETGGALQVASAATLAGNAVAATSLTVGATGAFTGHGSVSGATSNSGTITATGGTLTLAGETGGALSVAASSDLTATAAIAATSLTIAAGGSFIGSGSAGAVTDNGSLTASGGSLLLASDSGTGTATIASGATLNSAAALTLAGVTFAAGTAEVLALGTANGDTATISGFGAGTTIDLLNTAATTFTYNPTTGVLVLKNGTTNIGSLKFAGTYVKGSFQLMSDGHSGTDIVYTGVNAIADLQSAAAAVSGTPQSAGVAHPAPAAPAASLLPAPPGIAADFAQIGQSHGIDAGLLHVGAVQ